MNDVLAKPSLRQAYDAFAWFCLVVVAALSIHAGVTGAGPVWLAALSVIALGANLFPAIKRAVVRRIGTVRAEPGPGQARG